LLLEWSDFITTPFVTNRRSATNTTATMNASRQVTRNVPRFATQLRTPIQRRFASTAENEFIKERQHVKEHAKETTGEFGRACNTCLAGSDRANC
jgi:hypothetical protein